jgi:hypothetical protein
MQAGDAIKGGTQMRRWIAAAAAAACTVAHAGVWTFSYTGVTSPDAPFTLDSLDGEFHGEDGDGDGLLTKPEVTYLFFFHYPVHPAVDMGIPDAPPMTQMSQLDAFSFDPASESLHFTALAGSWHDMYFKDDSRLQYRTAIGDFTFDLLGPQASVSVQRIDTAEVPEVPEPPTWWMALVAAAGWAATRWQRRSQAASRSCSGTRSLASRTGSTGTSCASRRSRPT